VAVAVLAIGLALPLAARAQVVLRNMDLESHRNDYVAQSSGGNRYSACWGYVHGDGREYAIIGTAQGTAIYNVTDPANAYSVGFIPGPTSTWREMKAHNGYIYIVTETPGAGDGLQIVSMANPESPVLSSTLTTYFNLAHSLFLDPDREQLIVNGPRKMQSPGVYPNIGTHILSLTNPAAPTLLGTWDVGGYPASYAHDSFQRGDTLFLAAIYAGRVRVLDTSDPALPVEVTSWAYPGAFTHNIWPDSTGTVLYVTDEVNGQPLKVFDISDVMNPQLVNAFTSNPDAIVHNAHVLGHELYLANYTEGVRILDVTDPVHPAEFATADSYPGASGSYFGVWEVFPYFPSGTVIASDMQTGLYVYRPVRDYGVIRVNVIDADTQLPIPDVEVFLTTQGDSLRTPADGIVQFGPSPGAHTVLAEKFGWTSGVANVTVSVGSRDTVTFELQQKALVSYTGALRDAVSLAPLEDAGVELSYTALGTSTDVNGDFALASVPDDIYELRTRSPGHVPAASLRPIGPGHTGPVTIDVPPADFYDDLESATPWIVGAAGDDATGGLWTRVEPLGTGAAQEGPLAAGPSALEIAPGRPAGIGAFAVMVPGDIQPEFDRTPGAGQFCFVTGQGTIPESQGQADVDGGRTSLTTPALALASMTDAHIGWWQWFYSNGGTNDWFAVRVSNNDGATWTDVDTVRSPQLDPSWEERWIRVSDYVTPTDQVRLRFIAADLPSAAATVEAAVDDLIAWDQALVQVGVSPAATAGTLRFRAPRPNPAAGEVALTLELSRAGEVEIAIFDLGGRRVRTLHHGPATAGPLHIRWDGADATGRRAAAGLYFVRAFQGGESAHTRIVRAG
jgi:choice-of-anchor B domain-containing protein